MDQLLNWLNEFRLAGLTGLDLAVIFILFVSTLLAFIRGLVRESVIMVAWIGAVIVAIVYWPQVQEFLEGTIEDPLLLFGAAVALAFLVPLIVLKIVGYLLIRLIEESPLAGLDRWLGLVFGFARGALIAIAIYVGLLFGFGTRDVPSWVEEATLRPQLDEGYAFLREQLPQLPDPLSESTSPGVPVEDAEVDDAVPPDAAPETPAEPAQSTEG